MREKFSIHKTLEIHSMDSKMREPLLNESLLMRGYAPASAVADK